MEFNLADLSRCVADASPSGKRSSAATRASRSRQLDERATRLAHYLARERASGRATTSGCTSTTAPSTSRRRSRRTRSAPSRSTSTTATSRTSCATCSTTPTSSALVYHREFAPRVAAVAARRAGAAHVRRRRRRQRRTTARRIGAVDVRSGARGGVAGARLRAAVRRRPVHHLHRRHDRHAEGRDVAPRGPVLRRLAGRQPGRADIDAPGAARPRTRRAHAARSRTLPAAPLMHGAAQWAALIGLHGGGKVVLCRRASASIPSEIWQLVEDEKVNTLSIVGDAMARPLAEALATRARRTTRRRCS